MDYRALNRVTVREVFLIPDSDQVKATVAGNQCISAGDLKEGFNQCINEPETAEKMAVLVASGTYLPVAWVGLLQAHRETEEFHLTHALPATSLSSWGPRAVAPADSLATTLDDALVSREPILINDLRKLALESQKATFLRELVRATQMEALVALPLASGAGWEGFILFGSRRSGYRKDQVELLKNLAPTTALSLQRILEGATRAA